MKKIFKNIIFYITYCLANWLVFNIIFSIIFRSLKKLDYKSHINLLASIVFIVVTYLITKIYIKRKSFYFKNLNIKIIDVYSFILLGMLISIIFFILIYNIEKKFNFTYFERYMKYFSENMQVNDINKISPIETIITSVTLVPIGEELYFRKFGLNFLKSKGLDNKHAILLSALSFGLFHFRIISSFVSSFLIGVISGLAYVVTDKLRYSIFTHGLNNLLAMSSALYYEFILRDTPSINFIMKYNDNITAVIYIFIILLLLFLIQAFYKRKISYYKEKIIEIYKNL